MHLTKVEMSGALAGLNFKKPDFYGLIVVDLGPTIHFNFMTRFLFFILFFPLLVSAEEVYLPELMNLFEADVVMDASFKSQNSDFFWVTINEVIKGEHYGLKKGDTIKLTREDNGCGFEVDYSTYKRARFYIVKEEYTWRLNYHSIQSIQGIYQFGNLSLNDTFCGLSYVGEAVQGLKTMNAPIREFIATYNFISENDTYELKVSAAQLEQLKQSNIMVEAFELRGRCCLGDAVDEPANIVAVEPDALVVLPQQDELLHCDLVNVPPKSPFKDDEMRVFLNENENPLADEGIMGRVYVEFILDEQGNVSETKILRGLHPVLDALVLKKVLSMPAWTPALNNRNQGCKCKMVLPFRVEL